MRPVAPLALIGATCAALACTDPTHEDAVTALGGETPGVAAGSLHRPGQPCVTCHGDSGPASSEFSLAGTVYALLRRSDPAPGALVSVEDITGKVVSTGTNPAGNFYVPSSLWRPKYPLKVQVTFGNVTKQMLTHISRAASCADCHRDPPSQNSPGQIYIATNPSGLPGAPSGP